ncbi:MAG: RNA polymerase-binding protein DksA [Proteobacteria bacterium]|nr:RNA polymerase-binding protein DksA [Pseudomonadota bacterium]
MQSVSAGAGWRLPRQETIDVKTAAAKSPAKTKATPTRKAPEGADVVQPQASSPARPRARPAEVTSSPVSAASPSPRVKDLPIPMSATAVVPVAIPVKKDPRLLNNWKTKSAEELSDAEVVAMPDSEYMNDKQLAFFRLKLVQLKDDILANAGQTAENLRDDTVVVPDPADRATIEEEHALELRTRDRERKLLKKIEQSIGRIDAGDYGYCDETGEPIGVPRLLARPTATLSLEAQQRRELKQKMFGD